MKRYQSKIVYVTLVVMTMAIFLYNLSEALAKGPPTIPESNKHLVEKSPSFIDSMINFFKPAPAEQKKPKKNFRKYNINAIEETAKEAQTEINTQGQAMPLDTIKFDTQGIELRNPTFIDDPEKAQEFYNELKARTNQNEKTCLEKQELCLNEIADSIPNFEYDLPDIPIEDINKCAEEKSGDMCKNFPLCSQGKLDIPFYYERTLPNYAKFAYFPSCKAPYNDTNQNDAMITFTCKPPTDVSVFAVPQNKGFNILYDVKTDAVFPYYTDDCQLMLVGFPKGTFTVVTFSESDILVNCVFETTETPSNGMIGMAPPLCMTDVTNGKKICTTLMGNGKWPISGENACWVSYFVEPSP